MSWREQQRAGTFRGVPFFVEVGERQGGRQVVVHEYPFDETPPFTEDLGKQGRSFNVECYVIGDDYITARDRLLTALEELGTGELNHPYFGTRRVSVKTYRVRESQETGGLARFSIDFVESSVAPTKPTNAKAPAVVLADSSAASVTAVGSQFTAVYKAYATVVDAVSATLTAVGREFGKVLDKVSAEEQKIAILRKQVEDLNSTVKGLANLPGDLLATVGGLMTALGDALVTASVPNPSAVLVGISGFKAPAAPSAITPSRAIELNNYLATNYLVKRLALIEASRLLGLQAFVSYDDAVSARSLVTDALDVHLDEVTDDTFPALIQLRADLVLAVPGETSSLPRLQRFTPRLTLPSLVLAHQLYGSVSLEADLVSRNHIKNPGFVTGGVELEILSNG